MVEIFLLDFTSDDYEVTRLALMDVESTIFYEFVETCDSTLVSNNKLMKNIV
jgi:hypothetical protein